MRDPDDIRPKDVAEQLELGLARLFVLLGDLEDRAVVLDEADRPVCGDLDLSEIAELVLDGRQLPDPVGEGGVRCKALGKALTHSAARLTSSGGEHVLDEVVSADRLDGGEEARREPVVVAREEGLGLRGHVVQVARTTDAVALRPTDDELGRLERSQLLEDPGPTCAESRGEAIRRRRSELTKEQDDVPSKGRGGMMAGQPRLVLEVSDDGGLVGALGCRHRNRLAPCPAACRRRPMPPSPRCTLGVMDLDLAPEHVLLRDTVREFMLAEVGPLVDEHERARRFPVEVVRRLGEMGWLGIPIPEDEGGAGLDTLAYAIAIEEIGRVWGSLGLIVAAHTSLGCGPLHLAGTPDQKSRYLVPMASGKVLGGYGLTEPGAGSDAAGTRTTARHEDGPAGESWVIDGGKRFITNAGQAGTYIVTARTGTTDSGEAEISAFIVTADTPGFSVGRLEEKMGLHASATGELVFDGVRVPASSMLGERGTGFRTFLKILDGGRISIGALAVGLAQAALDAAVPYAQTREQFGRPIGTFQGVAFMIADMATEIEAARAMVWRAAWLKDQGRDFALAAAEAKLFASEVSSRATNAAIQVHGGYGYIEEYKVERYLRDAKLTEIGEGTSQIQRLVIARKILGLRVV